MRHPNSYPWANRHGFEVEADTHPHTSVPEPPPPKAPAVEPAHMPNEQVVQRGQQAGQYYQTLATDYGSVAPGVDTDLSHYNYAPLEEGIDRLIADSGYEVYIAGGKYGKPDLANRNYTTGHLMIYDPTPGSGGDFDDEATTRSWRKIHELAHGMTLSALNDKYGEARRMGKLGWHRTAHEAKRAVEWEWLTVHKQRELSETVGHSIDDATFARELNTVMHDAVHRAITGKFTNPDEEGFTPSDTVVPLEVSLAHIDAAAERMGLPDDHSLLTPEQRKLQRRQAAYEKLAGPERVQVLKDKFPDLAKAIDDLAEKDPTEGKQQYLDWAVRILKKEYDPKAPAWSSQGQVHPGSIALQLSRFHRMRKYMGNAKYGDEVAALPKDINKHKTFRSLSDANETTEHYAKPFIRIDQAKQQYPKYKAAIREFARADPTGRQDYLEWGLARVEDADNAGLFSSGGWDWEKLQAFNERTWSQMRDYEMMLKDDADIAAIREARNAFTDKSNPELYLELIHRVVPEAFEEEGQFGEFLAPPVHPMEFVKEVAAEYTKYHTLKDRLADVGEGVEDITKMDLAELQAFNAANEEFLDAQGESKVVLEDDDWIVYDIKDKIASCKLGEGRWCVSSWSQQYWESYTKRPGEWRFLMFKNKHNNDDFLMYLRNGQVEEVKDWNNEDDDLEGFPNHLMDELGIDYEAQGAPEPVEFYYATYRGDDSIITAASTREDLRSYMDQDEYVRGEGYEIYSATTSQEEWDSYTDGFALASSIEMWDEQLVEEVEPELETKYVLVHYGEDSSKPREVRSSYYEWFDSEREARDWVANNVEEWIYDGYALWSAELPEGQRGEIEQYWFDMVFEVEELYEFPPLEERMVMYEYDKNEGFIFTELVPDEGMRPLATYDDEDSADMLLASLREQGVPIVMRGPDGEVVPFTEESYGHNPSDILVPQEEQQQMALPGMEQQAPRQSKEGPSAGDYVVHSETGAVSVFGQTGIQPAEGGGIEEAKQLRVQQGRPNAPVWEQGMQMFRLVAGLKKWALSPMGQAELGRWLERDDVQFAIISAARDTTKSENVGRKGELRDMLEELGYTGKRVRRLRGQWYKALPEGGVQEQAEASYLILDIDFRDAIELGRHFEQDAIIYKDTTGNVGMYWLGDEARVTVPSSPNGQPLFGGDSTDMAERKPKPQRRGPPSPEDLWSKSRNLSFSMKYDWDSPLTVPWSGSPEDVMTRQEVEQHTQRAQPKVARDTADDADVELVPYDEWADEPEEELPRAPSVSDLPSAPPAAREHGFAATDLKPDGGYANIMSVMRMATPEEVDYWANWYPIANRDAQQLAVAHALDLETAAAVIAVLSPGVRWEENVDLAEQVILHEEELRAMIPRMQDPATGKWLPGDQRPGFGLTAKHPEFVAKALRILEARDPLLGTGRGVKGPKVEVFYQSMVDPKNTSRDIVLDGHAINIWRGDLNATLTNIRLNNKERKQMMEDYRKVADEYGIEPQEVQAITWSLWRAMKKHPQRPGTRMNLMGQLLDGNIDPDVVQLLADLNGMSVEEVMDMLEPDELAREAGVGNWLLGTGLAVAPLAAGAVGPDLALSMMEGQQPPAQVQQIQNAPKPKMPEAVKLQSTDIKAMVTEAATKHGVSPELAHAVAHTESRYRPDAVSVAGAQGVMQLMPNTARGLGVEDSFDPAQNIDGGVRYLKQMLDTFDGDVELAVRAYNAGPHNVKKWFIPRTKGSGPREWSNDFRGKTENDRYAAKILGMTRGGSAQKQAVAPAIMAAARWLLTNPRVWMLIASAYPTLKELWTKFQAGTATLDDAVAVVQQLGPEVIETYQKQAGIGKWVAPLAVGLGTALAPMQLSDGPAQQPAAVTQPQDLEQFAFEQGKKLERNLDDATLADRAALTQAVRQALPGHSQAAVEAVVNRLHAPELGIKSDTKLVKDPTCSGDSCSFVEMPRGGARIAARVRFEDEMQTQGEVALAAVKPGDRVRFDADFDKPGWPRVDAGTIGTVTGVADGANMLEVEAMGSLAAATGEEHGAYKVHASPDEVTMIVDSRDPRVSSYRIAVQAIAELGLPPEAASDMLELA